MEIKTLAISFIPTAKLIEISPFQFHIIRKHNLEPDPAASETNGIGATGFR